MYVGIERVYTVEWYEKFACTCSNSLHTIYKNDFDNNSVNDDPSRSIDRCVDAVSDVKRDKRLLDSNDNKRNQLLVTVLEISSGSGSGSNRNRQK